MEFEWFFFASLDALLYEFHLINSHFPLFIILFLILRPSFENNILSLAEFVDSVIPMHMFAFQMTFQGCFWRQSLHFSKIEALNQRTTHLPDAFLL